MTAAVEAKAPETNISTELAKERTRDAEERTLMAYIRTGFSYTSFGFGMPALVDVLAEKAPFAEANLVMWANIIGLICISLGVFAVIVALFQYRHALLRLERGDYGYQTGFPLGMVVGGVTALIGVVSFVGLVLKLIT